MRPSLTHARGRHTWVACLLASITCACAASTPAQGTLLVTGADAEPVPLPEGALACVRHSDCAIAESLRVIRSAQDCRRAPLPMLAVNRAAFGPIGAARERFCPPPVEELPPPCCPPVAQIAQVAVHASCVRSLCTLLAGAEFSSEERREESEGRGTDDPGECSGDADCSASVTFTAFPAGLVDAAGHDLCPVCPRLGTPTPREAERAQFLASRCPPLSCVDTSVGCDHRRCALLPERPARTPTVALAIPPEPTEVAALELPSGPDYACSATSDCVLGPALDCCNGGSEPINRAAAVRRGTAEFAARCPLVSCAHRQGSEPVRSPPPVCVSRVCTTRDMASAVRVRAREHARYLREHLEWEREVARLRSEPAPGEVETPRED